MGALVKQKSNTTSNMKLLIACTDSHITEWIYKIT